MPLPTFAFASLCLNNALRLLPYVDAEVVDSSTVTDKSTEISELTDQTHPAPPGILLSSSEIYRLR